jgi:hypothetical protein
MQSVWIITAWQHIALEVTVKGFKKCHIFTAVDGTDDDVLWKGSEEDGDVKRECVREMKALNVKMVTVTLIGKGR